MKVVNGFTGCCVAEIISSAAKQWLTTGRRKTVIRLDVLPAAISEVRRVAFAPITTQISATRTYSLAVAARKHLERVDYLKYSIKQWILVRLGLTQLQWRLVNISIV
jgi:hypothetical protein